jgi:biotin-(acetyl-CoA carboxylase) ligase
LLELPPDFAHLTGTLEPFVHLLGLTVVETCRLYLSETAAISLGLKWPNDIYMNDNGQLKKIGEIVVNHISVNPGRKSRILIGKRTPFLITRV